jgi:hypothetical protein
MDKHKKKVLADPPLTNDEVQISKLVGGILKRLKTSSKHILIMLPRVNASVLVLLRQGEKTLFSNSML